jgi:hypothetical protein
LSIRPEVAAVGLTRSRSMTSVTPLVFARDGDGVLALRRGLDVAAERDHLVIRIHVDFVRLDRCRPPATWISPPW